MKDFDFDELDRAVSSALGGQATGSGRRSADESRVSQASVSPADARAQSVVTERGVREEAPLEVPERAEKTPVSGGDQYDSPSSQRRSAPARPQTGRFMDVVHPSTDMRQTTPLSEVVLTTEVPEAPTQEVSTPPRQEVPMNDFRMVPRSEIVRMPTPKKKSSSEVVPEEEPWEPPVDSPFLPDAKVEKRPLGASEPTGFGDVGPAVAAGSAPEVGSPVDEAVQDFEQMSSEVNEIGSDAMDASADSVAQSVDATPVVIDDTPAAVTTLVDDADDILLDSIEAELVPEFDVVHEEPQELIVEQQVPTPTPVTPKADISEYAGPVEITPQYTSKPSSAEQSGEIFDTESYHQPFAAPVKKKGGALKIALILLLIIALGAGVGAVVYLYVLPML